MCGEILPMLAASAMVKLTLGVVQQPNLAVAIALFDLGVRIQGVFQTSSIHNTRS